MLLCWHSPLSRGLTDEVTEQILTDNGTIQTVLATFPAGITLRFARLRVVRCPKAEESLPR